MKGLELSEKFFNEYGRPMLDAQFGDILPFIAVGVAGSGSECFGFDDEISRDHDFEPGFCIFIPDEQLIDRKTEFRLERAYAGLPKRFMGFERSALSPVGGSRHGVIRIEDFFLDKTGSSNGLLTHKQWLTISEQYLAEATNGRLFMDNYGLITDIRERLSHFPEDIRRKKLAGNLLLMGQSGQYNYTRCIKRGEQGAAQLALYEFVKCGINTVFLLNKEYMPYYKWSFHRMRELKLLCSLADELELLITRDNSTAQVQQKCGIIDEIVQGFTKELKAQHLSDSDSQSLEQQAYEVNNSVKSSEIRNLHILCSV